MVEFFGVWVDEQSRLTPDQSCGFAQLYQSYRINVFVELQVGIVLVYVFEIMEKHKTDFSEANMPYVIDINMFK
jgi:hypothetical protein